MAEHAHITTTPSAPATRDAFDKALCDANIIAAIFCHLADGEINEAGRPGASLYGWLASELKERLEAIELANMAMRRV